VRFTILTEEIPPHFYWNPTKPIRGTEKFYTYTAKCLAKNHEVTVLYDGPTVIAAHNVRFVPREKAPKTCDAYLVCNPRRPFVPKQSEKVVEWTNFASWQDTSPDDTRPLIVISQTAKKLVQNATRRPIQVIGHGLDRSIYHKKDGTLEKIVVYSSSPDRGLNRLVKLWREHDIKKEFGYDLVVTAYGTQNVSDTKVASLLQKAAFWVHPGQGVELFCLAAVEAQACGATPIVVPNGALSETVMHGYRFTDQHFDNGLLAVLSGDAVIDGITADHIPDWDAVTDEIEKLLVG
jgi:glycosyltransferase involved in cell wall biosynthesis